MNRTRRDEDQRDAYLFLGFPVMLQCGHADFFRSGATSIVVTIADAVVCQNSADRDPN